MAVSAPAKKITTRAEGFYAWIYGDAGQETYVGITRAFNPEWPGWAVIDAYKKKMGIIGTSPSNTFKNNTQIPGMDPYVDAFYEAWWNKLGLSAIKDQSVANIIFDFIVNSSSTGTLQVETVLQNIFHANLKADRTFDQQTINLINAQNPTSLYNAIRDARVALYTKLANTPKPYVVQPSDTVKSISTKFRLATSEVPGTLVPGQTIQLLTQKQFLKGWLARLNDFPLAKVAAISAGAIVTGVGIFFLVRYLVRKKKKNASN